MLYVWIALLLLLLIAEAATVQLTTVWFALGALAALLTEVFHGPLWLQLLLFVVVSVVALVVTRPFVKKLTVRKIQPTNADRNIGAEGTVTQEIDNVAGKGLVNVKGITWTARSADASVIGKDTRIVVEAIEGVKLMVRSIPAKEP